MINHLVADRRIKPNREHRLVCLALICLLLAGCGYQYAGKESLPGGIHTIAIHVVGNRSSQTGLESVVTNALVNALTQYNPGLVVHTDQAQGILTGTVVSMYTNVTARSSPRQVTQRRVTINLSLELKDRSGKILWRDHGLSAEQSYTVSSNDVTNESRRLEAIDEAAQRLAEDAYNGIVHGF